VITSSGTVPGSSLKPTSLRAVSKHDGFAAAKCRLPRLLRICSCQNRQFEVELAIKARPIDGPRDRHLALMRGRAAKSDIVTFSNGGPSHRLHAARLVRFRRLELMPFGSTVRKWTALSRFSARTPLEPIGEQSPEHDPQLTVGRCRGWPCNDVVTNGIGPFRTFQNPNSSAGFVVCPADRLPQRGTPH
jgi:hypothetical protein